LDEEQAAYIRQLPTVVHIPRLHAYVVHAGILASDPREPMAAEGQPLATCPQIKDKHSHSAEERTLIMRRKQERSILYDIEQNRDHWVLQNMRSITEDGEVTK
jgi:hypothetical protein